MMSAEMKTDLMLQYGSHEYDYPMLSDGNVRSVIRKHGCKTFEELDKHCKYLNKIVTEIEEMKGKCMNKVYLMGRLTADPEVKITQNGKKVCSFTLAINTGKDKPAQFHDCVAWDNTAEFLGRYARKGNRILVEGRLNKSSYEKDGQRRFIVTVVADRVEYADGANQSQNEVTPTPTQNALGTAQNSPSQMSLDNGYGIPENYGINADDLPF